MPHAAHVTVYGNRLPASVVHDCDITNKTSKGSLLIGSIRDVAFESTHTSASTIHDPLSWDVIYITDGRYQEDQFAE